MPLQACNFIRFPASDAKRAFMNEMSARSNLHSTQGSQELQVGPTFFSLIVGVLVRRFRLKRMRLLNAVQGGDPYDEVRLLCRNHLPDLLPRFWLGKILRESRVSVYCREVQAPPWSYLSTVEFRLQCLHCHPRRRADLNEVRPAP